MERVHGFLIIIVAVLVGIWWYRKNSVPSPLDAHFADLSARASIGDIAQRSAWSAQPMATNVGSGWGTTMMINPNNPMGQGNKPGTLQLQLRFAQPGGF